MDYNWNYIQQYKTITGRNTRGINIFHSCFDGKTNVKVYLQHKYLRSFDLYDSNKIYTDNEPFKILQLTNITNPQLKFTPPAIPIIWRDEIISTF